MLKTRIIPVLLHRGRQLIKSHQFNSWRSTGLVLQAAKLHQARGVDELFILDIGATPDRRRPDFNLVKELTNDCFMPITIGGGIRTEDDIHDVLANGADKVVVGTAALEYPLFIERAAKHFGSQAIAIALDTHTSRVVVECGHRATNLSIIAAAHQVEALGAGEILLTDIERDGTLSGYNLDLIAAVSSAVKIPVVAAGGAGSYQHMAEALKAGAHAVAAGAMFQFLDCTPKEASKFLFKCGFSVRNDYEKNMCL